ncbi:MAG: hypothetical protein ACOC5T_02380 [Elusimicrobiota bacterium]
MRRLLYALLKKIAMFFLNRLINYMDKNKDGKIDKDEILEFICEVRREMTNLKRRL